MESIQRLTDRRFKNLRSRPKSYTREECADIVSKYFIMIEKPISTNDLLLKWRRGLILFIRLLNDLLILDIIGKNNLGFDDKRWKETLRQTGDPYHCALYLYLLPKAIKKVRPMSLDQ